MTQAYLDHISAILTDIENEGMLKRERMITTPQSGEICVGGQRVINLCANNYLGLADHPDLITAARDAMGPKGFGMASVRFICGTQDSTENWSKSSPLSWVKTILFYLLRVLMPTAGCSNRC